MMYIPPPPKNGGLGSQIEILKLRVIPPFKGLDKRRTMAKNRPHYSIWRPAK